MVNGEPDQASGVADPEFEEEDGGGGERRWRYALVRSEGWDESKFELDEEATAFFCGDMFLLLPLPILSLSFLLQWCLRRGREQGIDGRRSKAKGWNLGLNA